MGLMDKAIADTVKEKKDFKKIDERIKSVKDSQLKSSLISFLKAYNEKVE